MQQFGEKKILIGQAAYLNYQNKFDINPPKTLYFCLCYPKSSFYFRLQSFHQLNRTLALDV